MSSIYSTLRPLSSRRRIAAAAAVSSWCSSWQAVSVLVALIFGSVFHHQPYNTEATVWGRVGLIYLSTTFIGIVNMVRFV